MIRSTSTRRAALVAALLLLVLALVLLGCGGPAGSASPRAAELTTVAPGVQVDERGLIHVDGRACPNCPHPDRPLSIDGRQVRKAIGWPVSKVPSAGGGDSHSPGPSPHEVCEWWSAGVRELRSGGVLELESGGVAEWRSSGVGRCSALLSSAQLIPLIPLHHSFHSGEDP